jgi:DsrE/DsrF/DsrH-like protein
MTLSIVVVIRDDPRKTHRAVEGLRIALGLSTGNNPLTVVLLGQAPLLLTEDLEDIVDAEILEKHLPALKELQVPFLVTTGASGRFEMDPGFRLQEVPLQDVSSIIARADRVLVF